jgi:hypothetical protein
MDQAQVCAWRDEAPAPPDVVLRELHPASVGQRPLLINNIISTQYSAVRTQAAGEALQP